MDDDKDLKILKFTHKKETPENEDTGQNFEGLFNVLIEENKSNPIESLVVLTRWKDGVLTANWTEMDLADLAVLLEVGRMYLHRHMEVKTDGV